MITVLVSRWVSDSIETKGGVYEPLIDHHHILLLESEDYFHEEVYAAQIMTPLSSLEVIVTDMLGHDIRTIISYILL